MNDETSIPLQTISSINISNKLVYSTLEIVSTAYKAVLDDVPAHIAIEIKVKITSTIVKQKDMYDIAVEIRRMKELLDDGILTQDEFDAMKKQLLGILN